MKFWERGPFEIKYKGISNIIYSLALFAVISSYQLQLISIFMQCDLWSAR